MKKLLVASLLMVTVISVSCLMVQATEYDFGGRTVRIVTHDMTKEGLWGTPFAQAHFEAIEKKFNAKIEIVAMHYDDGSIINDLQQGLLAGTADGIYYVKVGEAYQYANEGFFFPLTEFDIEPCLFDEIVGLDVLSFKGERYFFCPTTANVTQLAIGSRAQQPDIEGIVWNKTKFEEMGLPNLYELVENGEWTWEKFKEIAIEATRDLDGDGDTDIWGYSPYAYSLGIPRSSQLACKQRRGCYYSRRERTSRVCT